MLQTAVIASEQFSVIVMLMIIVHFCSPKQRKFKNCPLSSNPPHIKSPGLHSRPAPAWHQCRPLISMRKHPICTSAYDWKKQVLAFYEVRHTVLKSDKISQNLWTGYSLPAETRQRLQALLWESVLFVWEQMSGRDFGRTHSVKQSGFDSYLLEGWLKCKAFLIRISYSSGS